jgi:hypothetical protein
VAVVVERLVAVLDRLGEWWSRGVAPETYGLFSDEQTKNILWCDDRQCVTSFELASCFASYSWLPVNSRYVSRYIERRRDTASRMATALALARSSWIEGQMYKRGEPLDWK